MSLRFRRSVKLIPGVKNSCGNVGHQAALYESNRENWDQGKLNKSFEAKPKSVTTMKIV